MIQGSPPLTETKKDRQVSISLAPECTATPFTKLTLFRHNSCLTKDEHVQKQWGSHIGVEISLGLSFLPSNIFGF